MELLTDFIGRINKNKFLSEFTFLTQKSKTPRGEEELADCAIWFDNSIVIYQLKDRDIASIGDFSSENKWFINKVRGLAKKQIKNSVKFYSTSDIIEIENLKGHGFNIKKGDVKKIYKIIIYRHETMIALGLKHYISKDVGFIHIFDYEDYSTMCDILDTPSEIFEYLEFREKLLSYRAIFNPLTEKNILGVFIQFDSFDDFIAKISEKKSDVIMLMYEDVVDSLIIDKASYDIDYILKNFEDKIYTSNGQQTSYYKILVELSKTNRSERKSFKERWEKCSLHVMTKKDYLPPHRMIVPTSECGIIFIPVVGDDFEKRVLILNNLTILSKYDLKMDKHIGISFCYKDKFVYVDYMYIDYPWEYKADLEEKLKDISFFRPLKEKKIPRYYVSRK